MEKIELLISEDQIKERVRELGKKISEQYRGRSITLISELKGGTFFVADLAREIKVEAFIDYIEVSSYKDLSESSGNIKILKDLSNPVYGRDVIIVDEIVDTGFKLKALKELLNTRGVKSIRTCVLLDKKERRKVKIKLDYVGFVIPDVYVVGYGIAFHEKYRNLPYIAMIRGS